MICISITFSMLGLSYAAVPLYKIFCQITGYGGTIQRAEEKSKFVSDQRIRVRFDANVSHDLGWKFIPKSRSVSIKLGQISKAIYEARNVTDKVSYGTASFNVSPQAAGIYFNKLECFCFTQQRLSAGESMDMPVVFFVDPEILNDPLLKRTKTITLSYTFFLDKNFKKKTS